MSSSAEPKRVLIAGGGVGGLEAALALRAIAPGRVDVRVLTADSHFTYRPLSVGEPFGHGSAFRVELAAIARDRGFEVVEGAVETVDPGARRLVTHDGASHDYNALVLALGARAAIAVPGALTFRGPRDVARVRDALDDLRDKYKARVIFSSGGSPSWTLPLYELALMTADWSEREGLDLEILIVTAEPNPLSAFGDKASAGVARLLDQRGIRIRTGSVAGSVDRGRLWIPLEGAIPAELVVALPILLGRELPGLPGDPLGFVEVDDFCRVAGHDDIYAVGDMASRPLKQGGLATQQADVAARAIAAWAGEPIRPEPYEPILRGLLLTGREPLYLRYPPADEQLGPPADAEHEPPWWPAHKIVGEHLAPYLATHAELLEPLPAI